MIRLNNLRLKNFRCFEDCMIEFQSDLTVLVARNGQGKTAILDAIALAFSLFIETVARMSQRSGFDKRDVRRISESEVVMTKTGYVELQATAHIGEDDFSWRRWMQGDSERARTSRKDAKKLITVAQSLRDRLWEETNNQSNEIELPLLSFYRTGRQWDHEASKQKRSADLPNHPRCIGYVDSLDGSTNFGMFTDWYETMFRETSSTPVTGERKADRPERLLAAVNRAVESVLEPETGWNGLHWNPDDQNLMMRHPVQGLLPLSFLSDGVRNTVALVADIAHRCARLNPHFGENAAHMTPGILLIDEVDLHLHPEWQQSIIRMLRDAFPKLQLVVSTHSPQVLSTVDVRSIRVIRFDDGNMRIFTPKFQTKGVESADVLAAIMGVDPVPKVQEAKWLSDYRALIEDGLQDGEPALTLKKRLLDHFGSQHPLMLECERLLRFSRFKRSKGLDGGVDASA